MSKARNLVQKARKKGEVEGRAAAVEALKSTQNRPKPTIVHVEPKVDTAALAREMEALKAIPELIEALGGNTGHELDVSGIERALVEAAFDPSALIKAVSSVAEAVGEQSEVLQRLAGFEAQQSAIVAALNKMIEAQKEQATAMEELTKAYRAKRVLTFTDGGATLEAK